MQTKPSPPIDGADLKAARDFLLADRDGSATAHSPRPDAPRQATVPIRNGIARARMRPAARKEDAR